MNQLDLMYREMGLRADAEREAAYRAATAVETTRAAYDERTRGLQQTIREQEEVIDAAERAIERVRNHYLNGLRAITQTNDVRMIHQLAQQMIDAAPKPQAQHQPGSAPAPARKGFMERIFGG